MCDVAHRFSGEMCKTRAKRSNCTPSPKWPGGRKSRGEPYLHTMNATPVLSVVLSYLASDVNPTPRDSGDGRIRYRCEFGYRLFDSYGEIATQVERACPFAWPHEQNSCRTHWLRLDFTSWQGRCFFEVTRWLDRIRNRWAGSRWSSHAMKRWRGPSRASNRQFGSFVEPTHWALVPGSVDPEPLHFGH